MILIFPLFSTFNTIGKGSKKNKWILISSTVNIFETGRVKALNYSEISAFLL